MIAPHIFMLSNNKNKYVAAERQSTIGKYYSDDSNPIFDAIDKFVHSSSIRFLIDHDGVKTCRILLKAFYNSSARYFQSVASFSSGLLPAKILVLCLSSALVDSAKAINQARAHVSEIARLDSMVRENVIAQIANIKTHPPAALGLEQGHLNLHGWIYDIEAGSIDALDGLVGQFVSLADYPHVSATQSVFHHGI